MTKLYKNRPYIPKTESSDGWHSRGYFPHFDGENLVQHVTIHLADSLPQTVLALFRQEFQQMEPLAANAALRTRIQGYLDAGYGKCWMRNHEAAAIVQATLLRLDAKQYFLHAWCIMPNHIQVLFTPVPGFKMSNIVGSWKSVTSRQCRKILEVSGLFWHKEYFDRYIRNERHYRNAVAYIENNPVKAGLCKQAEEWPWSSATLRAPSI